MNVLQLIQECQDRTASLHTVIPVKIHQLRIAEIDELISAPNAWDDNRRAAGLLKERQQLVSLLESLKKISDDTTLLAEYVEAFPEEVENVGGQIVQLEETIIAFELKQLLTGPHDNGPAILAISAGAGGAEAKNFAMMLSRLYMRYADSRGWKTEILDEKPSEEHSDICLDSISLQITGDYAYGYLKGETGVMRLIRNSPFNSASARHTSFAAVSVMPDIEDKIEIEIKESDIEWDVMRASGSGGQSVNRTESACRIRHLPTGIAIRAQTEKSQHENRRIALKLLKAKLYELELRRQEAEQSKIVEAQQSVAFGHQIRSYILSPFQLVKNHRSGFESNQADKVLDGALHEFILDQLRAG